MASVMLMASCTDGEGSGSEVGGGSNNNGNGSGGSNTPTEQPIEVEALPEGVVIGTQTLQLNSLQLKNVLEVDDDNATLFFSSSLPDEQIPQKGQIILQYSSTELLPYGFLGRVTSVAQEGDKIIVETDVPTLKEAFDKFEINYDMNNVQSRTRAVGEFDDDNYMHIARTIGLDDPELSCVVDLGVNIAIWSEMDANSGIDFQLYRFGLKADTAIDNIYKREGSYSKRYDVSDNINFQLPNASPALMGTVQFSWFTEADGNLDYKTFAVSSINRAYNIEKQGEDIYVYEEDDPADGTMHIEFDRNLKFEGNAYNALGIRVDVCLFGRKELSVGVGSDIGTTLSSDVDLLADSDNLYDLYKDMDVEMHGVVYPTAYVQSKLFGTDNNEERTIGEGWYFWDKRRNIFPSFTEMSASYSSEDEVKCSVYYDRDLLFESGVGVAQYNDEELINMTEPLYFYNSEDLETQELSANFKHMSGAEYWTYVKWGDKVIRCEPYDHLLQDENDPNQDNEPSQGAGDWTADMLIGTWKLTSGYSGAQYMIFRGDGTGLMYISADDQVGFEWTLSGSDLTIADYEGDITTAQVIQLTSNGLVVRGQYDNGVSGTLTYEKVAD